MFERAIGELAVFVSNFLGFAFLCAIIGPMGFFVGQLWPRKNFNYRQFPFAPFKWEREGMIYLKIGIQYWKDRVPDISQYIKSMVNKRMGVFRSCEYIRQLIVETCIAEMVHFLLILASPAFLICLKGTWGLVGMISYIVGNIPFILIQRYNRPRLIKLLERQTELVGKKSKAVENQLSAAQ